jgi:alpha-glucosidase
MMVEATIPTLDGLFEYYGTDSKPIAHFPFNFEFINRVKPGFNGSSVIDVVDEWFTKMPEGRTANWLVGNHDNHRVAARFGDYVIDPLNMIIHLLPGSSVTYYGEEIGMQDTEISWEDTVDPAGCNAGPDRYQIFSRDPERTPMQWNDEKNSGKI